jgi:hypothetical protein
MKVPRNRRWVKVLAMSGSKRLVTFDLPSAFWIFKFMLLNRELTESAVAAYVRLTRHVFRPNVTGDITPYYAALRPSTIRFIRRYIPDARILYILRNPVDRDFSELSMYARDHQLRQLSDIPAAYVDRVIDGGIHSNYLGNLINWVDIFGRQAVHVELFESLTEEPQSTLGRIQSFLGVSKCDIGSRAPHARVNASKPIEISSSGRLAHVRRYQNDILALAEYLKIWPHIPVERVRGWSSVKTKGT